MSTDSANGPPRINSVDDAPSAACVNVVRVREGVGREAEDWLAIEEPLAIRLIYDQPGKRRRKTVSVTMRTPGHDVELAVGFLFNEGLIRAAEDIAAIDRCGPASACGSRNTIRIELRPSVEVSLKRLERNSYMSSSCGVCGKTSLESVHVDALSSLADDETKINAAVLRALPETLRAAQPVFQSTGGLHASALFDATGQLLSLREDVGRHNALDKLIGSELLSGRLRTVQPRILLLSGRASFELIQKAVLASFPVVAAIGAPSSLAVQAAAHFGVTLVGFLRQTQYNVYSAPHRLVESPLAAQPILTS